MFVSTSATAPTDIFRPGEFVGYLPLDEMQRINRAVLGLLDLD